MTQCKSIRKDDVNVTAAQLGVKVGDKFVVLPPQDSYGNECFNSDSNIGDILVLEEDDGDDAPYFTNLQTGLGLYESFACLARYEEKQEQEEDDVVNNNVSLYSAEYYSAEYAQDNIGDGDYTSYAVFKIKGLTPKQYSDILAFINNMK